MWWEEEEVVLLVATEMFQTILAIVLSWAAAAVEEVDQEEGVAEVL